VDIASVVMVSIMTSNKQLYQNNVSGYRGVHWQTNDKGWVARITRQGIRYYLGFFKNFDDAVDARLQAEVRIDLFNKLPE
jgi:hypothetical protein